MEFPKHRPRVLEMLDDFDRDDGVERLRGQWSRAIEVGLEPPHSLAFQGRRRQQLEIAMRHDIRPDAARREP